MAPRYSSPSTGRVAGAADATGASAVVFLFFVAAGCAYIVLAKLAGIGPFCVTFVPVGTMLAYALLIYSARGLRLRDDQSGDNLYYMGFLFTLTSLGVSLYQFTAARAAEEIVQNFGIAIGSTIAGIGLRVIFNQMRRDPASSGPANFAVMSSRLPRNLATISSNFSVTCLNESAAACCADRR